MYYVAYVGVLVHAQSVMVGDYFIYSHRFYVHSMPKDTLVMELLLSRQIFSPNIGHCWAIKEDNSSVSRGAEHDLSYTCHLSREQMSVSTPTAKHTETHRSVEGPNEKNLSGHWAIKGYSKR